MLGFIGTGNMATAIIKGVISSGMLKASEIAVFDILQAKSQELSDELGVQVCESEIELAQKCAQIVLSVKPNIVQTVLNKIDSTVSKTNPLIISIAAGKDLGFLQAQLTYSAKLVRVMPNINALVGAAVSAYCHNENVDTNDLDFAEKFCSSFGKAIAIEEKLFANFAVIGGCSPAFVYMFIDAMARAAVKNGMSKAMALEISAASVLGSAKLVLESEDHPWELVDKVCSPGGMTIEGVVALQENGFESSVAKAVQACVDKDKKL